MDGDGDDATMSTHSRETAEDRFMPAYCSLTMARLSVLGALLAFLPIRVHAFIPSVHQTRYHQSQRGSVIRQGSACLPSAPAATTTDITFLAPKVAPDDGNDFNQYPSLLHAIHVKSILSDEESAKCLELANEYAAETGRWEQPDAERHATYATCDFPVEECLTLETYLKEVGFDERIWSELSQRYGVKHQDMEYLDFFCAHYQAKTEDSSQEIMDRLEEHRDGSLLSFTVVLTPPEAFAGGGTFFDALRDVESDDPILQANGALRPTRAGDAVLHSGKILHGGAPITAGKRTVLVGFIDVAEWCYRPGVLSAACCDWGRMDVATNRWKRQQAKTVNGEKSWLRKNQKWLPPAKGRSHIQGVCPAFSSVERRADKEYQRRRKLEAEDVLLRNILLPEDERDGSMGGDITIL